MGFPNRARQEADLRTIETLLPHSLAVAVRIGQMNQIMCDGTLSSEGDRSGFRDGVAESAQWWEVASGALG